MTSIVRSAHKFMRVALSQLSQSEDTSHETVIGAIVAEGATVEQAEKVVSVLSRQGFVEVSGAGGVKAHRLSESGVSMITELGGE